MFRITIDSKIIAIRLENTDNDNVIWTNDFVYEECNENNLMFVRLARDAVNKESYVTKGYNRPRLMKTILKSGYGAEDNGLPISDCAIYINEKNIQLAEDIICGNTKYLLPIVYVTKCFCDNETILDVEELAKDLAGTAHVIVEGDTRVTAELKEKTNGINPFNGAVHIFYTNRVGTRIIPDEFSDANSFRYKIVNSVCHRLSLVKVEDKYTWGTIKYQKLLETYHQNQQSNLELEKACDEIIKLKEREHAQLVEDMETELNELRSKVQNYEYSFNNRRKVQTGNIVFDCSEEEFFEGEVKDMILKLLESEMKKMDMDPNQKGWRKYHVLQAILHNNKIVGKGEELASELKDIPIYRGWIS